MFNNSQRPRHIDNIRKVSIFSVCIKKYITRKNNGLPGGLLAPHASVLYSRNRHGFSPFIFVIRQPSNHFPLSGAFNNRPQQSSLRCSA